MTQISMKIDDDIKTKAEALFNDIGITMTTAVNLFLQAAIREQTIPFGFTAAATKDDIQAVLEFEADYEENSKCVDTEDFKKRMNLILNGG